LSTSINESAARGSTYSANSADRVCGCGYVWVGGDAGGDESDDKGRA
jgi:hypothetical protein